MPAYLRTIPLLALVASLPTAAFSAPRFVEAVRAPAQPEMLYVVDLAPPEINEYNARAHDGPLIGVIPLSQLTGPLAVDSSGNLYASLYTGGGFNYGVIGIIPAGQTAPTTFLEDPELAAYGAYFNDVAVDSAGTVYADWGGTNSSGSIIDVFPAGATTPAKRLTFPVTSAHPACGVAFFGLAVDRHRNVYVRCFDSSNGELAVKFTQHSAHGTVVANLPSADTGFYFDNGGGIAVDGHGTILLSGGTASGSLNEDMIFIFPHGSLSPTAEMSTPGVSYFRFDASGKHLFVGNDVGIGSTGSVDVYGYPSGVKMNTFTQGLVSYYVYGVALYQAGPG